MYAMETKPWYNAQEFIPTFGMLLGNSMSGIAVALKSVLEAFTQNKNQVELHLSFGATKWEAARPIIVDSLRLALLPTLNSMSIIGMISIPG